MKNIKTIAGITFEIVVGIHVGRRLAQTVTILFDRVEKALLEKGIAVLKKRSVPEAEEDTPHMELNK